MAVSACRQGQSSAECETYAGDWDFNAPALFSSGSSPSASGPRISKVTGLLPPHPNFQNTSEAWNVDLTKFQIYPREPPTSDGAVRHAALVGCHRDDALLHGAARLQPQHQHLRRAAAAAGRRGSRGVALVARCARELPPSSCLPNAFGIGRYKRNGRPFPAQSA